MIGLDDPWRAIRELRQDVRELRGLLEVAGDRIQALEAEHEADVRREAWELREAAERGREPACGPPGGEAEPAEYDPGPECDDEGGMSEYRHALPADDAEVTR